MAFFRFLAAAVALAVAPVAAFADSIAPSSYSATLGIGGSTTVTKTVTVDAGTPTSSLVDVFFLADTTGSMYGAISAVQSSALTILGDAAGLGDVAFGVGEYKDFGDTFVYRMNTNITTNTATAQAGINLWGASGGGDYPEANLFALSEVANGTTWRTGSARILVWFGDAPGHDPSGGATEATATSALNAKGIKVQALNTGTYDAYAPGGAGYRGLNDTGQATRIATATGGSYQEGVDTSNIVAAIQAAITNAFATYTTVGLDLSGVPAGVTGSYSGAQSGTWDRSVARTFSFTLTFVGVNPGDYSFNVYGTVDSGRVATESDRIIVSAVPLPGAAWMGMSLLGLLAVQWKRRQNRDTADL